MLRQHHELESTLDEKTQQGRREAEDIRSQIAPLLEERVRRHESEAHLFAEMERLRESLVGVAPRPRRAAAARGPELVEPQGRGCPARS